jgi:hypothetical protein
MRKFNITANISYALYLKSRLSISFLLPRFEKNPSFHLV